MSDERRRARERAAALGEPGADAAVGREECRAHGHAVRLCETDVRRYAVYLHERKVFWFYLVSPAEDLAHELNAHINFAAMGGVAWAPADDEIVVSIPCPRCGEHAELKAP